MHTFKLCTATITLVLFNLFSQSSLLAQTVLIDDHTDRTNVNEFDGYWYYYDDYRTVYENDRGYLAPASRQSEINVDYEIYPPRNYDDFSKIPEYKRIYTFTFDEENGNTFATMPFTFGEPWETYTGEANSYVGLATMLAPEGECIDLNEATAISFKIRSRSKKLTFFFKVMTVDITNDSSECYYRYELTTDTQWKEYKINFTDLTQPEDTPESAVREFSISQVTNIVWEVVDINATMVSDTIDLDDIIIYDYFPPHVEPPYIIRFVPPETGQFSAFETTVHELTPLGTNWYAFTDRLNAGSSEINDGAVATDASGYYKLEWVEGSGGDAFGYGPYIVMTFGGSVSIGNSIGDTITADGYAGIGCNLYDSAAATYLDLTKGFPGNFGTSGTSGSIYFEYLSDGDFDCMTLELLDINDVPDKNSPTRKFIRGPDNVWHRDFPLNYMQWSRVEILFDSLVLDGESDGSTAIPLDITHLAKLQFKVRGKEGQSGQIIIDNVYFPDESTAICNRGAGKEMHESVFSTTSHGGFITGFWKNCVPRAGTVVEIIRMDGVVAKKVSMSSPGIQKVSVPIADLSPGGYVISVQGVSTTGEKINHRKCITLIK